MCPQVRDNFKIGWPKSDTAGWFGSNALPQSALIRTTFCREREV